MGTENNHHFLEHIWVTNLHDQARAELHLSCVDKRLKLSFPKAIQILCSLKQQQPQDCQRVSATCYTTSIKRSLKPCSMPVTGTEKQGHNLTSAGDTQDMPPGRTCPQLCSYSSTAPGCLQVQINPAAFSTACA